MKKKHQPKKTLEARKAHDKFLKRMGVLPKQIKERKKLAEEREANNLGTLHIDTFHSVRRKLQED